MTTVCGINEVNTITFELASQGITSTPSVYFTIVNDGARLSFPAINESEHTYTATVPALNGLIDAGPHQCEINVIIGTKFFTPFTQSIDFLDDISALKVTDIKVNNVAAADVPVYMDDATLSIAPEVRTAEAVTESRDIIATPLITNTIKPAIKMNVLSEINSASSDKSVQRKIVGNEKKKSSSIPVTRALPLKITRAEIITK